MAANIDFFNPVESSKPPRGVYLLFYPKDGTPKRIGAQVDSFRNVFFCRGPCCSPELWAYYKACNDVKQQYRLNYLVNVVEFGEQTVVEDALKTKNVARVNHVLMIGPLSNSEDEKACLAAIIEKFRTIVVVISNNQRSTICFVTATRERGGWLSRLGMRNACWGCRIPKWDSESHFRE